MLSLAGTGALTVVGALFLMDPFKCTEMEKMEDILLSQGL